MSTRSDDRDSNRTDADPRDRDPDADPDMPRHGGPPHGEAEAPDHEEEHFEDPDADPDMQRHGDTPSND